MKILFIHNRYQQRGGEDTVFEQELELMGNTEEVQALVFQNLPGWRGALQFFASIWNISSARKIRKAIDKDNPELIHVHNWHYTVGPIVVRTAKKKGIPVVLTIPNFRLLCPSATLLYKDTLFTDSVTAAFPWKAVWYKVYRNSFFQTFWLAFIVHFHKRTGTWKMVDKYILLTEMAKDVFLSSSFGIPASRFVVKPNFIKDKGVRNIERENFFLFIGRLSEEKGIETLLTAFKGRKSQLIIGGDGPLKEKVIAAGQSNPNIEYLGLLDANGVHNIMSRCAVLIFPSIWYEGMPMTLIEAFAAGTPVIASKLGAMASMINDKYNGLHFAAGNAAELSDRINFWEELGKTDKQVYSQNARTSFERLYTPEVNQEQSLAIYHSVIEKKPGFSSPI